MKKRYFNLILIFVVAIFSCFCALTACSKNKNTQNTINIQQSNENSLNNTASEKQQENPQSKDETKNQFIAPFVDMCSWVDPSSSYSYNGAPYLSSFANETGNMVYSLGFIQLNQATPTNEDGSPRWGWGGYYDLSPKGNDGYQYEGIKNSIQDLQNMGGDVIVSFGGQLGKAPWTVCSDKDILKQMYEEVIATYKLSRIDLDIEESNQDANQNYINATALKEVQDETGIKVTLTIPISPSGWKQKQINLIIAYLGAGVDVDIINSMTMCYYNYGLLQGEDYADASIRALTNAKTQLQQIYSVNFGKELTDEEAFSLLGATVAIGAESGNPDFTRDLTKKVVDFCKEKQLRMMAFWNMERDAKIENNSGITDKYAHLTELFKFEA